MCKWLQTNQLNWTQSNQIKFHWLRYFKDQTSASFYSNVWKSVGRHFFWGETHKIIVHIPRKPSYGNVSTTENKEDVAHRFYSSIVICWKKIPAILRGIFDIFGGILKCLYIFSTLSRGKPAIGCSILLSRTTFNSNWFCSARVLAV
jgi:hypothetical protein